jgi:hypothetical protein
MYPWIFHLYLILDYNKNIEFHLLKHIENMKYIWGLGIGDWGFGVGGGGG